MRKSACIQFYEKFLWEVSNGRGYREHDNPAIRFSKDVKAGKYNEMSDGEYGVLLKEAEDLSAIWLDKSTQKAFDILRVALENIDIDRESLHKMAEILSECYFSTGDVYEQIQEPGELQENHEPEGGRGTKGGASDANARVEYNLPFPEDCAEKDKIADEKWNSPQKIYKWLSKRIYGQKDAVKAAAILLYNHRQGRKRNILFAGPTGSGKTEIWRVCKQIYPHIRIVDSTVLSAEGWTGSFKLSNIFEGMSRQEAEKAIIVFDEFDKLCEPKIASGGTNHSLVIQNELLKPIEGTTIHQKTFDIDTSKISFVFCGSFERLTEMKADSEAEQSIGFGTDPKKKEAHRVYEDVLQPSDLVRYAGMRQEIAGRIHQIVQLSPMTAGDYREILKDKQISPLRQLERQYGVKLCLDTDTEEKLLQEAEETRMGVRYLRSRIQQMLDEQMFQSCDRTEYTLGV